MKKNKKHYPIGLFMFCFTLNIFGFMAFSQPTKSYNKSKEAVAILNKDQLILNMQDLNWGYQVIPTEKDSLIGMYKFKKDDSDVVEEFKHVKNNNTWNSIVVGKRWETLGYPELNDSKVWLRFKFIVPKELEGKKIGFFCTAIDDVGNFFLNNQFIKKVEYHWWARIPDPTNVDLTEYIKYGVENELIIQVNDIAKARGGGLLGNVLLYHTIPFKRTSNGGIEVEQQVNDSYSVFLHLSEVLLSHGVKNYFTNEELGKLNLPPYILRDDELILIAPSKKVSVDKIPYRLDLENVSATNSDKKLTIKNPSIPGKIKNFELLKIPLTLTASYKNAFDPKEISVKAIIATPSKKIEYISGYFQQDFRPIAIRDEEEILLPKKGNSWFINFRPREEGLYNLQIIVQDINGIVKTDSVKFEVLPSTNKGFLRVSEKDPRFFEFDNGDSYFGIGPSGWYRNSNYTFGGNPRWNSTRKLTEFYEKKAANGGDFDYFLVEYFGRLFTKGGYMDQHIAWKIEQRVRTLERLGIYWLTCYDDLSRSIVYGFNSTPYSKEQGGPCEEMPEVYFNESALELQKKHLRYFVGRLSDSPAILAWSLGDESQPGRSFSRLLINTWIKELHNYVKSIDIYEHPHIISEGPNSLVNGGDAIIVPDWYFKKNTDAVSYNVEVMKAYSGFNCPIIIPEGGMVEWTKPADQYGPTHQGYYLMGERWKFPEAISFHNHLWISLFSKNAVGGTEWLGQFIAKKEQLFHGKAMKEFLKNESLTKNKWLIIQPEVNDSTLNVFGLMTENQTWVWLHNQSYNWIDAGHDGISPTTIKGKLLRVPVLKNEKYLIEIWDTRKGIAVDRYHCLAQDQKILINLPDIQNDVAFKIIRQN